MASVRGLRSPLSNSTNDLLSPTPSPTFSTAESTQPKLRRTVSLRTLHPNADSSESDPSEHSSIFESLPLRKLGSGNSEVHVEEVLDPVDEENSINNENHTETPLVLDDTLNAPSIPAFGRPQSSPHSRWPDRRLETITEQKSISTLRPSQSLPRMSGARPDSSHPDPDSSDPRAGSSGPCPGSSGTCPGSSGSATSSVTPSVWTTISAVPRQSNAKTNRKRLSLSLDDMCLPPGSKSSLFNKKRGNSSSSSSEIQVRYDMGYSYSLIYPNEPVLPPTTRTPTPPGLPSFGSPEAMGYNASSRSSRPARSSSRRSSSAQPTSNRVVADPTNNRNAQTGYSRIRKRLSFSSSRDPRSIGLPAGVIRAPDGTVVRGRFGTRQSGHGVGAGPGLRGVEDHPFHRRGLAVADLAKDRGGDESSIGPELLPRENGPASGQADNGNAAEVNSNSQTAPEVEQPREQEADTSSAQTQQVQQLLRSAMKKTKKTRKNGASLTVRENRERLATSPMLYQRQITSTSNAAPERGVSGGNVELTSSPTRPQIWGEYPQGRQGEGEEMGCWKTLVKAIIDCLCSEEPDISRDDITRAPMVY